MLLKAGYYSINKMFISCNKDITCQVFDDIYDFTIEERSISTVNRGYKKDRLGSIIFPGEWTLNSIEASQVKI